VIATPEQHKESLKSAHVQVKRVERTEGTIIEIRIDKRGVLTRTIDSVEVVDPEKVRSLERIIRGRCGQILMN